MMRRVATALLFLATAAAASEHGVITKLSAYASPEGPLNVRLEVTNHREKSICFFVNPPFMSWSVKGETDLTAIVGPDHRSEPDSVQVAWNDGHTVSFNLDGPGSSHDEARKITKLTYYFTAFDCVALFSHPRESAPVLFRRQVSVVPTIYD